MVREQKFTDKFQILFYCFKFCSAVSNSVFAVSNSVLLFEPEVMYKLDFIIYDNYNILLKFIQIFPAKYCNLQNKMAAREDWFVFPIHIAFGGG